MNLSSVYSKGQCRCCAVIIGNDTGKKLLNAVHFAELSVHRFPSSSQISGISEREFSFLLCYDSVFVCLNDCLACILCIVYCRDIN